MTNISDFDKNYITLLKDILENGTDNPCRTGNVCRSVFTRLLDAGEQTFDSIPISNLRKIFFRGAVIETFWFLGLHAMDERYQNLPITNTRYMTDYGVHYWDKWSDKNGNLGPVYGAQLTQWKKHIIEFDPMDGETIHTVKRINQIWQIIDTLNSDVNSRRLVTNLWNPAELNEMALPPCHYGMQFNSRVNKDGERVLDLTWIQRSCDMPIGIPYNVLQYAIIQKMVALCTNHKPGRLCAQLGNCHIYDNQIPMVEEMIRRYESGELETCPQAKIAELDSSKQWMLSDFAIDGSDFKLIGYKSLPELTIPVAI